MIYNSIISCDRPPKQKQKQKSVPWLSSSHNERHGLYSVSSPTDRNPTYVQFTDKAVLSSTVSRLFSLGRATMFRFGLLLYFLRAPRSMRSNHGRLLGAKQAREPSPLAPAEVPSWHTLLNVLRVDARFCRLLRFFARRKPRSRSFASCSQVDQEAAASHQKRGNVFADGGTIARW